MCIVIGKYFEDVGWVGFKNRDRNYLPEISFKKVKKGNLEILYFWDDITQYCEGMNSAGVGVLSASLMVSDDEKEITNRSKTPSKDGIKIKKALTYGNVKAVAMSLIDQKLTGNTLIFNKDHMFLLEGTWRPGEYKAKGYEYVIKEIKKEETICRTNHGIWIEWAGYQYNPENVNETTSRISSESSFVDLTLDIVEIYNGCGEGSPCPLRHLRNCDKLVVFLLELMSDSRHVNLFITNLCDPLRPFRQHTLLVSH